MIFGNKWLTHLCRIAVGGLFIFSGLVKANDPVGFSIKLEEYFDVFSQGFSCDMVVEKTNVSKDIPCSCETKTENTFVGNTVAPTKHSAFWDFWASHSLFLAVFICGFEIAVGIFLLLGLQRRWTLFLLLAMIVFFAFLTFYSACCNKVQSCGCFGDAIKLTPWESFWKDLILLILISVLFVGEQNINPLFKNSILLAGIAGMGIFFSFAFPVYCVRHLPFIDFRPYAIGTNLYDASHEKDPAKTGCVHDSVVMRFFYKHKSDGQVKEFPLTALPDSTWDFCCRYDDVIRKGNCQATVLDFNLIDPESGASLNDSLLQRKGIQFFLVMWDLGLADKSKFTEINTFADACGKNGIPFNGLSSATEEQVDTFRLQTHANFHMLTVDGTALKTVIRSNPGLVMLKDGVVTAMWHYNDFPTYESVIKKYSK
ncbi:MAG TPA: BT_3928 family protein [Bacteroidia bacterium]|nr:BT_3928 family protein [Bacteroidia bacterium]